MRHFALTVAYDGTSYGGWQIQANSVAVQQILMEAIAKGTGESVHAQGSGRTDAGVHAIGQVASISLQNWRAAADCLVPAINRNLPKSIIVRGCREAHLRFDPIRAATSKRYRYSIRNSRIPDPLLHPFHWFYPRPLDLSAMQQAANDLIGTHDFKAFESNGSPRKSTVRTVLDLTITSTPVNDGYLFEIEIEADGFLYNMVRNITGALCEVGVGRLGQRWLTSVLDGRVRDPSSQTAPAQGLCLVEVTYPDSLFLMPQSSIDV
jgi:tRNA pseudouridine38-40 synthase